MIPFHRSVLALALVAPVVGCSSDDSDGDGNATVKDCVVRDPVCADAGSECLSLVDNTGKDQFMIRLSQLQVSRPAALVNKFVENLIQNGIDYDMPDCYLSGLGTFSWLLELDLTAGKLRTGGAKPGDPTDGYCFDSGVVDTGSADFSVAPVETTLAIDSAGKFTVAFDALNVPIYNDSKGDSAILLPLHKVELADVTLSKDRNCIGTHNGENLRTANRCLRETDIPAFNSAGTLTGYITLEEADTVTVTELKQTFCVLLGGFGNGDEVGDGAKPLTRCKREGGKITLTGDWCSTTNSAATAECADAVRLEGTIAGNGVKLRDDCP